jgi:cytoskeletal protein CcmA (bactofilin family)|tara:strand:+ start:34 stop:507 length:474 start_codon:yes stop_codon:yes gene_type:complete
MGIFDKIQDTTAAVTSSDKNTTSIGENCTIDGDITFDKTIEIHGKITGTVKIAENCTTAMLIIKKNGIVEGDVYGDEVVIEGEVIGNVTGKKKITIKSSSFVSGNVYYDILDMNGGATVNGNLIRNKGKEPQKLEDNSAVSLNIKSADKEDSKEKLL